MRGRLTWYHINYLSPKYSDNVHWNNKYWEKNV